MAMDASAEGGRLGGYHEYLDDTIATGFAMVAVLCGVGVIIVSTAATCYSHSYTIFIEAAGGGGTRILSSRQDEGSIST